MGDFGGSKYGEKRHGATCRDGWRRRKPSAGVRRVAAFPARRADESGRFRSGASVTSKVWRCRKLYAALVALCVLFSGVTAYAVAPNDQGVLWGPTQLNNAGDDAYCVCANNNFDAALWVIGKWNTKIQLSNDMFAMLSNADTGGRFYTLASLFHSYRESGSPNWPNAAQIEGYAAIFGLDAVWTGVVPDGLVAGAREDYLTILGGGSLGGGGSDESDYLEFTGTTHFSAGSSYRYFDVGGSRLYYRQTKAHMEDSTYLKCANELTLRVPTSGIANFLGARPSTQYDYICKLGASGGVSVTIYAVPAGKIDFEHQDNTAYGSGRYISRANIIGGTEVQCYQLTFNASASNYTYDDGVVTVPNVSESSIGAPVSTSAILADYDNILSGGIHQVPTIPPSNWPDEPTTDPDPPEVPSPDPPDNPDPDPWPDPPSDPVFDPEPPSNPPAEPWTGVLEPTQYTDYTPWLRAILQALNDIGTALGTHCVHLQEAIAEGFYEFSVTLEGMLNAQRRSLQGYLKSLLTSAVVDLCNQIDDSIYDLEQYMKSLAQWLASQFDFSVSGGAWDDSTVVSWLKKIYWELQGRTKRNPSEPDVDNDLEWWQKLLQIITEKLGALVTDFVGDVGDFLEAVKSRFPFSVPWDVAAYLALLGAAPQTPHFTFVIPAISGWWPEWEIEIDLSAFDSVAAVCRQMMLILWAFCLILKTDWLGGVFDGAAHAVTGFFDRAVSRVAGS